MLTPPGKILIILGLLLGSLPCHGTQVLARRLVCCCWLHIYYLLNLALTDLKSATKPGTLKLTIS